MTSRQGNTPAPKPRGRAAEAKTNDDAVLNAAREVFAEQGYNAPMSAIAERAKVGVASIYRRYESKDELTLDLRMRALRHITVIAEDIVHLNPPFAVRAFIEQHLAEANTPLATTFGKHVLRHPDIDTAAEALRIALEALIALDTERGLVPDSYGPGELLLAITHLRPAIPTSRARATELHLRQLDHYIVGLTQSVHHPELVRGEALTWAEWMEFNSVD